MLKKLLLTAALLSSTYGAATDYVDPDFSLLANRSETLVIDEEGVVIHPDAPTQYKLRRLTQSEVSTILSSDDCKVLSAAAASYVSDIFRALIISIILKADTTSHNGVSEAQDATFLSQLFWKRVSLLDKTLQAMLLSPQSMTKDQTRIIQQFQAKLTEFSARHDHSDTTPFYDHSDFLPFYEFLETF